MPKRYLLFMLLLIATAQAKERTVKVCDSDLDYPPFSWTEKNALGKPELRGFSVELLKRILYRHGWRFELDWLPFNRCLRAVREGQSHQLVLTASSNAERERQYFVSDPFWQAHFHAFYSRNRFPDAAPVKTKVELRQFKICGMAGQNFSMFEVPAAQLDMGADNYPSVFQKLKLGRCDIFPYNIEVIEGYRVLGQDYLADPDLAHVLLDDVPAWPFRMLISRNWSQGLDLTNLINAELARMWKSGELEKLYAEVLHTTPYASARP